MADNQGGGKAKARSSRGVMWHGAQKAKFLTWRPADSGTLVRRPLMTCEICVINRHAAVLAADSASTVSRWVDDKLETRYFKGANKIFQLSHHQPVGVMI